MEGKLKNKKQYRYKNYDYSQGGMYFVTICTKEREMFFGEINCGKMELSEIGLIADKFWQEIPIHLPFVILDAFAIMPNHIHGIIEIEKDGVVDSVGTGHCPVPTAATGTAKPTGSKFGHVTPKSLSTIIGSYKSIVTKNINLQIQNFGFAWQPRFNDRIIRDGEELNRIREYIQNNPAGWERDRNNKNDSLDNYYKNNE